MKKLRVLHIGNIANNAYLNAKMLNQTGRFDCDVLCYSYYHIMGCPEWEDADFDPGAINDHFDPDWGRVDLRFTRPDWFVQGPFEDCMELLLAKRSGDPEAARRIALEMSARRHPSKVRSLGRRVGKWRRDWKSRLLKLASLREPTAFFQVRLAGTGERLPILGPLLVGVLSRTGGVAARVAATAAHWTGADPDRESRERDESATTIKALVSRLQKGLAGQSGPKVDDFVDYLAVLPQWRELLEHYDIVHGYATDGIWALLANKPYVAYEHGTIRRIPFEEGRQGRICSAVYRCADAVCITNCDNIEAAGKLELKNYVFVPHPVNEEHLEVDQKSRALRKELCDRLASDFIIFHPSRQHWDAARHPSWEKGNDLFIRGFARFVREVNPRAAAVFVDWGDKVRESKALLVDLGIADRVHWVSPLPNREMVRYIHATDGLADQFWLGAFGSTTPKALACGKPVLLNLNEETHRWCFEKMPPVVNCKDEEGVFEGLRRLYTDEPWRESLLQEGLRWYRKFHSNERIVDQLSRVYDSALKTRST